MRLKKIGFSLIIVIVFMNILFLSPCMALESKQLRSDHIKLKSSKPIKTIYVEYEYRNGATAQHPMTNEFLQAFKAEIKYNGLKLIAADKDKAEVKLFLTIEKFNRHYLSQAIFFGGSPIGKIPCLKVRAVYITDKGNWSALFSGSGKFYTMGGSRMSEMPELARAVVNPLHYYWKEKKIIEAAAQGDKQEVVGYLGNGVNINASLGDTALISAVNNGQKEMVELLLSKGAAVDTRDRTQGATALSYAVRKGDKEIVDILLQHGARIDLADNYNKTPLAWAIIYHNPEMTDYLLDHNEGKDIQSAFSWAVSMAYLAAVENLFSYAQQNQLTVNCNAVDVLQCIGLNSSERSPDETVQFLLLHGCLELKGNKADSILRRAEESLLIRATREGNRQLVGYLLDAGADAATMLPKIAAEADVEMIKFLLEKGVDLRPQGGSALVVAEKKGNIATAKFLADQGADSNYRKDAQSGETLSEMPVSTLRDLQNIGINPKGSYYLTNDIDCSATVDYNGGAGFEPIPEYTGTFDGRGHTLSNLTINRINKKYVGLFSNIGNLGQVKNLVIFNAHIAGEDNVGTLAGKIFKASVSNVTVRNSVVMGAGKRIGGMLGESYNGEGITNCAVRETVVKGKDQVGGLVGSIWDGTNNTIFRCEAIVDVTGTGSQIGGIAGYSKSGDIIESYAAGTVRGGDDVGGIVGYTTENAGIHNCYNRCRVSGINYVAGICGYYNSYHDGVSFTYSAAEVTGTKFVAGFLGFYSAGKIEENNYWDCTLAVDLPGISNKSQSGIIGKSTAEMKQQGIFRNWDFQKLWIMDGGYPIFQYSVTHDLEE
ncbi:MAG: ankyrin repeat domain-containing protein [Candidatus Omnitrophica bacterium]|nr:ankyrin repeat domain-containing protein [Candidatus Omnitrophota bacterium]